MKKTLIKIINHVFVLTALVLISCSKSARVMPEGTSVPTPVTDTFTRQTPGMTNQSFTRDENSNITDYLLYIPDGYNERQEKWPLVIFLHGTGEMGTDVNKVKVTGLPKAVKGKPFVMVAPQCRRIWWNAAALEAFYKFVVARYHIDPKRIYLTGLSMGGIQSWAWAEANPEHFAAVIPIAGRGDTKQVDKIKTMPVWAFHAANDPTVSVAGSRDMVNALKAIGGNVKYTEYPDGGHDSWTRAYATEELYTWMLQQRKP
ncbi:prolyl oligopeptidase family serine peptidase [Chitinophaga solisilvae]|nr:prolyl oligopeptidase family serine peptidase [Chitinophaga solisilvae]